MHQLSAMNVDCQERQRRITSTIVVPDTSGGKNAVNPQAPVVRKPISANPRLNCPDPRNKFVLRLNSVPRSSISTIQGLN